LTWDSERILRYLYDHPETPVAIDTETSDRSKGGDMGLRVDDGRAKCIGISIAFRVSEDEVVSHYWGIDHWVGENVDTETVKKIRYVLSTQTRTLIWMNVQFDVLSLETVGIECGHQPFYDIATVSNLVNENRPYQKSLDQLAAHYLGPEQSKMSEWPWEAQFPLKTEKVTGWPNTTPDMMSGYAEQDAVLHLLVWEVLMKQPEWEEIDPDFWEHKQEFIRLLTLMRRRGVRIDQDLCAEQIARGEAIMDQTKRDLGLNPGSIKDRETLFLKKLGMPVLKRSAKTDKPSFDKSVMEKYERLLEQSKRPEATLVKTYTGWQKAVSASYRPYLARLSPDGRLRTEYTTHVTSTGRLSSKNPNLQQISKGSDGKKPWSDNVKKAFIAKPGHTLISADFSQLELRLATVYAQEPTLIRVFEEGRDIFTEMSQELDMTRQDTKTLVYSMQYGAGVNRLMGAFNVNRGKASEMRTNYAKTYRRFTAFNLKCQQQAERGKKIKLWSGRYRHFQYPSEGYKAMNSLIQGGAADIVERIMVRLWQEIDNDECQILLTVHDSVVFEIRDDRVEHYSTEIERIMTDVGYVMGTDINVRFAVELEEMG
jgi:DNA polymerase-1